MAARAGMALILTRLRAMAAVGTADYSVADATYWTDDQLQALLDEYRWDWREVRLVARSEYVSGTTLYKDYFIPVNLGRYWERAESGSEYWAIRDASGNEQGTALYTADYEGLRVRFAADQGGTAYYLDGRNYDLNRAAAAIWRRKAAHYATDVDWSSGNHSVRGHQTPMFCLTMAETFERAAGPTSVQMVRADANVRRW